MCTIKEKWKGKNEREQKQKQAVAIKYWVVSEGISEKVTFEQRLERGQDMSNKDGRKRERTGSASGRRNTHCKISRAEASLV